MSTGLRAAVGGAAYRRAHGGAEPPPSSDDYVSHGMYVTKAELDAQAMSGTAWTDVLAAADSTWPAADVDNINSQHDVYTLSGAIVYARMKGNVSDAIADPYRVKVSDAIQGVIDDPLSPTVVATGRNRKSLSVILAADLINLAAFNPTRDTAFRAYLTGMLDAAASGSGMTSMRNGAERRPNNHGTVARSAVIALALYLGDAFLLETMAQLTQSWILGHSVFAYPAARTETTNAYNWDSDQSWQATAGSTSTSTTNKGITPAGAVRDGHMFDGLFPEEMRRNCPYSSSTYPCTSSTPYPSGNVGYIAPGIELLHRAGYAAKDWGNQALKRAVAALKYLADNYTSWDFAPDNDAYFVPLINYMYGTSYPALATGANATGHNLGWTQFTHNGRTA